MTANNNTSFSTPTGYPQISTFGKKHAQQKLDKPIAIDGEQEYIIDEEFYEDEPIDLEIDLIDFSPF